MVLLAIYPRTEWTVASGERPLKSMARNRDVFSDARMTTRSAPARRLALASLDRELPVASLGRETVLPSPARILVAKVVKK